MEVAAWALMVGGVLVLMSLSGSALKHLPLSTAMLYLPAGLAIGPLWAGLAHVDPVADAWLLEHMTEVVVVVSLFSVGLKLSLNLDDRRWLLPLRLALGSMVLTVGLIALAGLAMGLPLGAAVLLPGLCHDARPGPGAGPHAGGHHAGRGGGFHRRARPLGDTADGPLRGHARQVVNGRPRACAAPRNPDMHWPIRTIAWPKRSSFGDGRDPY